MTAVDERAAVPRRLAVRLAQAAAVAVAFAVPVVFLLLLVRSQNATMAGLDADAHDALRGSAVDSPALADAAHVAAFVTHPWFARVAAVVLVAVLWWHGRRRVAAWLAATAVLAGALSPGLKHLVARARPVFDDPIAHAGGYSFPSGHALGGAVAAGCLVVLLEPRLRGAARVALWTGAVTFALVAGVNRIALGVHYLSDVLAGWLVGVATVVATTVAFAVWRREAGLPVATPGEELEERAL